MMLSGLGPADHLKSIGIQVQKDIPGVGQNLQVIRIYRRLAGFFISPPFVSPHKPALVPILEAMCDEL